MNDEIHQVAALLSSASRVLVITGAGVSAESGIPTFRGAAAVFPDGRTEEGILFEEVLSGTTFSGNPTLSWKYFFLLEACVRDKLPNAGHHALARMQGPQRLVCVATQNIDGLHQAAGSSCVLELHGNLNRVICTCCDYRETLSTFEGLSALPRCPACCEILRPDIVLYEEPLPHEPLEALYLEQQNGFDLVFSVGTTSLFRYVVEPVVIAARAGIPVVEINPDETPVSDLADFRFNEPAGKTLPAIVRALQ
jgi:NAD-dependent deacetylase